MSETGWNDRPNRMLMLRPHPWAHHPVLAGEIPGQGRRESRSSNGAGSPRRVEAETTRARVSAWVQRLAERLAAIERHVQRLATRPPWFP